MSTTEADGVGLLETMGLVKEEGSDGVVIERGVDEELVPVRGGKVYVGNLPEDASEDDVRGAAEAYGRVVKCWVARRPPGFGFIEFASAAEAERAVEEMNGGLVKGVRVKVELSKGPRASRHNPPRNHANLLPLQNYSAITAAMKKKKNVSGAGTAFTEVPRYPGAIDLVPQPHSLAHAPSEHQHHHQQIPANQGLTAQPTPVPGIAPYNPYPYAFPYPYPQTSQSPYQSTFPGHYSYVYLVPGHHSHIPVSYTGTPYANATEASASASAPPPPHPYSATTAAAIATPSASPNTKKRKRHDSPHSHASNDEFHKSSRHSH